MGSAEARAQNILEREFLIGPRAGLAVVIWDVGTDVTATPDPHLTLGVDLRKELEGYAIRFGSDLQSTPDLEHGAWTLDLGVDGYLGRGEVGPYLGVLLGMRVGSGPVDYLVLPFSFGGGGRFGLMFNRSSQTRFFVEATTAIFYSAYTQDSLGTPTPPDFTRTEISVAGGVLF